MSDVPREGEPMLGAASMGGGTSIARRAGEWLTLAAAPVFAMMALLTATNDSAAAILCGAAIGGAPWHGMTLMYVLMSVFHAAPWLKLFTHRADRQTWTTEHSSGGANA